METQLILILILVLMAAAVAAAVTVPTVQVVPDADAIRRQLTAELAQAVAAQEGMVVHLEPIKAVTAARVS